MIHKIKCDKCNLEFEGVAMTQSIFLSFVRVKGWVVDFDNKVCLCDNCALNIVMEGIKKQEKDEQI